MKEESDSIRDMIEQSGLDAAAYAGVADALASLDGLIPEQAPAPSAELAAAMSGGSVVPLGAPRYRRRGALVAASVAAAVVVGTGAGAAANVLPEPAQRFFNEFSDHYLPFEFPSPDDRSGSEDRRSDDGEGPDDTSTDQTSPSGGGQADDPTSKSQGEATGTDQGGARPREKKASVTGVDKANPNGADNAEKGADNRTNPQPDAAKPDAGPNVTPSPGGRSSDAKDAEKGNGRGRP